MIENKPPIDDLPPAIVLQDYTKFLQYAAMVATDPAIIAAGGPYTDPAATPTDSQIITAVSSMWNAIAGNGVS